MVLHPSAVELLNSFDNATVVGGGDVRSEGLQHLLGEGDPVGLLVPQVGCSPELAGSVGGRQEDGHDREQVRDHGHVDIEGSGSSRCGDADLLSVDGDGTSRGLQDVQDPPVSLGVADVESLDGHAAPQSGRHERERGRGEVTGHEVVRGLVLLGLGGVLLACLHGAVGLPVERAGPDEPLVQRVPFEMDAEAGHHPDGDVDVRLGDDVAGDLDGGGLPCDGGGHQQGGDELRGHPSADGEHVAGDGSAHGDGCLAVVGGAFNSRGGEGIEQGAHGPLLDGFVPGEGDLLAERGAYAGQETERGAGVLHVDGLLGSVQVPSLDDDAPLLPGDGGAHGADGVHGGFGVE